MSCTGEVHTDFQIAVPYGEGEGEKGGGYDRTLAVFVKKKESCNKYRKMIKCINSGW